MSVLIHLGTVLLEAGYGAMVIIWLAFAGIWNRKYWRELRALLMD